MKFVSKWFRGICEQCHAKQVLVREMTPFGFFWCEGCAPSRPQWIIGKCAVKDCEHESVSLHHGSQKFLCWEHQSSARYAELRYLATSSERR